MHPYYHDVHIYLFIMIYLFKGPEPD